MNSLGTQVVLGLMTLAALTYTVLAYPGKYNAPSGRSRLFRTVGIALLDLLLLLLLMGSFIDWRAELHTATSVSGVTVRFALFVLICLSLCFALVCVAALDSLESYSLMRRQRRVEIERTLREQIEEARAEAAAMAAAKKVTGPNPPTPPDKGGDGAA